jgi:hypothetical protein
MRVDEDRFVALHAFESWESSQPATPLLFDARERSWHPIDLPIPRSAAIVELGGGRFLVTGGFNDGGTPTSTNAIVSLS